GIALGGLGGLARGAVGGARVGAGLRDLGVPLHHLARGLGGRRLVARGRVVVVVGGKVGDRGFGVGVGALRSNRRRIASPNTKSGPAMKAVRITTVMNTMIE